jgi:membrane-associated phospholipid phosphatase
MPHPLLAHLIEPSENSIPTRQPFSRLIVLLVLFLSMLTVLLTLITLFRLDFEVVLFLRSLHNPTIDEIGRIGNRLGHGTTLVLISIGLGVIGYVWKRDRFIRAGWQSLIAHGIAGLFIQIIKHLLGRPRPRFMHQDQWEMGPSFQGGLDTFPSGHSAAAFAVAAVLTRQFPKGAWMWYGVAAFVAISRVMRGSHFPSDTLAGSLIGFLVGYIMSRPLKDWLRFVIEALVKGLPYWVGGFTLIWIIFHNPDTNTLQVGMIGVGLTLIAGSLVVRVFLILRSDTPSLGHHIRIQATNLMLGMGIAFYTGSLLVTLLAICTGIAWWMGHPQNDLPGNPTHEGHQMVSERGNTIVQVSMIGLAVIAILIGIHQLKGLIPLQ